MPFIDPCRLWPLGRPKSPIRANGNRVPRILVAIHPIRARFKLIPRQTHPPIIVSDAICPEPSVWQHNRKPGAAVTVNCQRLPRWHSSGPCAPSTGMANSQDPIIHGINQR